jgi:hypothetical protein
MAATVHRPVRQRAAIALAVLLGVAAAGASSAARAQGAAPWCLNGAIGFTFDCRYQTLEQCVAVSRGLGGICTQNPRFGNVQGRRYRGDRGDRWDGWRW